MKITINPGYRKFEDFIESIPDIFDTEGEIIYNARNVIKKFDIGGLSLGVKSYRIPILINKLAYSYFRPSKAERAYEYAMKLTDLGINTPAPVAYIEERKFGFLNRSYFIYVYEDGVTHIREEMLGHSGGVDFERALAAFIADMHNKGFLPLDLSPGNILWRYGKDQKPIFYLIDFNRMTFMHDIPLDQRYKSFKRISERFDTIANLAREYARICNLDQNEAVREIYNYCYAFSKEMKKQPKIEL